MSKDCVYEATSRNLSEEIRWEKFEKRLVDYKGLVLFICDGVPKFELLRISAREVPMTT